MAKTRLLWIGCLENEDEFKAKSKKGYNLASAQVSQSNIISGIEEVSGLQFDSINGSVLHPYPIYPEKIIKEVIWSHKENTFNISVGYRNIKLFNRITCRNAMINAVRTWTKERYQNESLIVFVYSMRSPVMAAACEIKKLIPNAKIFLIVTDLPQYMDLGQSKLKAFLKKIDWLQIKKMQNEFDGFILYAQKMAEFLGIPNDKWLLMEGSYDASEAFPLKESLQKKSKAIMYSGAIDLKYGLDLLINSFNSLEIPDVELWITGGGKDSHYVKEQAKLNHRIKYFGFLPSREDVLIKQQQASMLINMRLPTEPASTYSFPSKLFEYMASSTPVLSFKLEGIPCEYYNYLSIIENHDELQKSIINTLNMSETERNRLGSSARDFILNNKNNISQSQNIMNFITNFVEEFNIG